MPGSTHFGWSVDPASIQLYENTIPIVEQRILASTTISSWSETDPGSLDFDINNELGGPLPIAIVLKAVGELGVGFYDDGEGLTTTNMVVIGDTDFATNNYFGSANNADLFVNAVNFLAKDFELISIRTKTDSNRQLFLTKNERDFVRWSGWLLMPGLISIFGFWTWWRRR
jgi:hypothetical protein